MDWNDGQMDENGANNFLSANGLLFPKMNPTSDRQVSIKNSRRIPCV